MRIDSSTIGMDSARRYSSALSITTKSYRGFLRPGNEQMTTDYQLLGDGTQEETGETAADNSNTGTLAERMEEMRTKMNGFSSRTIAGHTIIDARSYRGTMTSIRDQSFQYLFYSLFGQRRVTAGDGLELGTWGYGLTNASGSGTVSFFSNAPATTEIVRTYSYSEAEQTTFSAQGTVKCADGREISFNLNLEMSRSFQQYYQENYVMPAAVFCDPLVINLDGNIAEMADQTFLFDIDSDGEQDNISRLGQGSGYLALDKNGDGTVNDGSELFGTASGNGFADLAKYDSDGNGWIDEGDEIWNKLKIWVMDENGESQLYSLAEKGLGAIGLAHVGTDFTLTDAANMAKGKIRQSGIFLYENGGAGTVQQVDVAKLRMEA